MNTTIADDTILTLSPDVVMSDVDGEIMLICITSGRYVSLDAVASEMWRRLQTPLRFDALSAGLSGHFDGDPAVIDRDARRFVAVLAERELVTLG